VCVCVCVCQCVCVSVCDEEKPPARAYPYFPKK